MKDLSRYERYVKKRKGLSKYEGVVKIERVCKRRKVLSMYD